MTPYLTSYLRFNTSSSNIEYTKSVWIFTTGKSAMGMFAIVGGAMAHLMHPRIVIIIGCLLHCGSYFLAGWLVQYGFLSTLLTYGLMQGIGVGIGYPMCLKYAQLWFPSKNGLMTGIVMTGFGLGSFIFGFFQTALINPHNLAVDVKINTDMYFNQAEVLDNVEKSFFITGAVCTALLALGLCLMPFNKKFDYESISSRGQTHITKINQQSSSDDSDSQHSVSTETSFDPFEEKRDSDSVVDLVVSAFANPRTSGKEVPPRDVIFQRSFWVILIAVSVNEYPLILISNYYKPYGQTFIDSDSFLTLVGSLASLANAFGRLFWGLMLDFSSFKSAMIILSAAQAILSITLPFSSVILSPEWAKFYFTVWVCGMNANAGAIYVLNPTTMGRAFGMKFFGVNYGMIFCVGGLMGVIFTEVISAVLNATDGYTPVFLIGGAASFISEAAALMWNVRNLNGNII
ncbi:apicoplast pyruvate carrier 1-like isoform X2 [Convolutriloba macropyga]